MSTATLTEMQETLDAAAAPEQVSGTFQELLGEFAALEIERREHEERLKVIGERLNKLSEPLINCFADEGIQNINVKGLTVYVRMDRYCSKRGDASTEQVCAALKSAGLGYMVGDSYNASSLKSKIKEYIDEGAEVPENLKALLNIGEVARLATRK